MTELELTSSHSLVEEAVAQGVAGGPRVSNRALRDREKGNYLTFSANCDPLFKEANNA